MKMQREVMRSQTIQEVNHDKVTIFTSSSESRITQDGRVDSVRDRIATNLCVSDKKTGVENDTEEVKERQRQERRSDHGCSVGAQDEKVIFINKLLFRFIKRSCK